MSNRIKGKLALVTGASAGIGEAVARKLAENGVHLIITARRIDRLEALAGELRQKNGVNVYPLVLDVCDRKAVEAFGRKLEEESLTPDILINNAGLSAGKDPIFSADIGDWEVMVDTNIKGFLYVSRAVIPLMMKRNAGHIVNLGSIAGEEIYPGGNVYNATKFAVRALSKAMNVDLVNSKIRVANVAPGAVRTEFSLVRFKGDRDRADSVYHGFTPLAAEDVADCIVYILNTPEHVNIQYMVVTPTAQRDVNTVNRDGPL